MYLFFVTSLRPIARVFNGAISQQKVYFILIYWSLHHCKGVIKKLSWFSSVVFNHMLIPKLLVISFSCSFHSWLHLIKIQDGLASEESHGLYVCPALWHKCFMSWVSSKTQTSPAISPDFISLLTSHTKPHLLLFQEVRMLKFLRYFDCRASVHWLSTYRKTHWNKPERDRHICTAHLNWMFNLRQMYWLKANSVECAQCFRDKAKWTMSVLDVRSQKMCKN